MLSPYSPRVIPNVSGLAFGLGVTYECREFMGDHLSSWPEMTEKQVFSRL
jgi:hypothetical protein